MIRVELTTDDALLLEHYRLHWLEMGVPESDVRDDWAAEAALFLRKARNDAGLAAFLAREEQEAIGTACCQLIGRAFPAFRKTDALSLGYVWGLYVRPPHRGKGTGRALLRACMGQLKQLGCGRVLLHAGELSAPLYSRLGFEPTDELTARL